MSVKENLIAARALIDTPEKWGKYGWSPRSGQCLCALGAVVVAANGDRNFDNAWTEPVLAVERALMNATPHGYVSVASFNDADGITHADIMALFDRAIAAQESQP